MAKKRSIPAKKQNAELTVLPEGYHALLHDLKERIRNAQVKVALAANRELLALYWHIGSSIVDRQQSEGWGTAVIDRLGKDLQAAFPGVGGFSRPNIYRMRAFTRPMPPPHQLSRSLRDNWKRCHRPSQWPPFLGSTMSC